MVIKHRFTYGRTPEVLVHNYDGANSYGQLGLGNQDDQLLPQRVSLPDFCDGSPPQPLANRIRSVTGGGGHSVIIQDDGSLFVCGSNCKGQLGLNHYNDVPIFTKVDLPEMVEKVSAGWDFTVILSEKGDMFVCGSNEFGQLGFHPGGLPQTSIPMKVPLPANYGKIIDIAAGLRHTAVLTAEGKVYCWGIKRKIKDKDLLTEAVKKSIEIPVLEVSVGDKFVKLCAGSFHTLVLTEKGNLWIFGTLKYGTSTQESLSKGDSIQIVSIPISLFDGPVTKFTSGWTHCLVESASGRIYSWGRGNYGQLGRSCDQSHDSKPQQIQELHDIKSLECGSEHSLVTTDDGRLLAWGWNEHGMCATGNEDNVQTPTLVKALSDFLCVDCGSGSGHCFALCKDKT
ncbi:secretion-regulating guanine nucleotide exchange factor-like isoform X2 [Saccostrea echinata]|uniref:secretion-regulating guanine nucleotide exchange factor-like isoform X2 n=1 Tax=Saccostrea echinata TaxID=191078 RepID=UPI002A7F9588|nr:secretion-regulating guanine nucleotide exchange factor-like isoform X2 [Saccostrea echinata]